MTRRPLVLVALLVAIAVGGFLVYAQFLAGDNVPPLTLPPASPSGAAASPMPAPRQSRAAAARRPRSSPASGA
ncbi:MAG: hypothetical protein L0221_01020 [Chloroflexi bacterium]|nr:hypothetical protein [Chloroflexota bacterium]